MGSMRQQIMTSKAEILRLRLKPRAKHAERMASSTLSGMAALDGPKGESDGPACRRLQSRLFQTKPICATRFLRSGPRPPVEVTDQRGGNRGPEGAKQSQLSWFWPENEGRAGKQRQSRAARRRPCGRSRQRRWGDCAEQSQFWCRLDGEYRPPHEGAQAATAPNKANFKTRE